jgi:hypothetical protein
MSKSFSCARLVVGALLLAGAAAAEPATESKATGDGNYSAEAFERLKKLAGDWQYANPKDAPTKGQLAARYRVIAGGSAVVETIFPDSDMEMVSVYHRDGGQLVMTHYCCCGNQPHLRATAGSDKDDLIFEFTGGCNLNAAKDMHMHGFRIHFVDDDHLRSECELYAKGKLAEKHGADLVRKK